MKRIFVSVILAGALLALVVMGIRTMAGSKPQPQRAQPRAHAARVQAPSIQPMINQRVEIVGYGAAQPRTRMDIAPRITGEVVYKSNAFRSGRLVQGPQKDKPGEILFRIDSKPFQLAVDSARQGVSLLKAQLASLDQEKTNLESTQALQSEMTLLEKQQLERVQSVFKRGVGTQNEVDIAQAKYLISRNQLQETQNQLRMIPERKRILQAQLEETRVKLRQAELSLGYTTYHCPVSGRIIRADVELGEQVLADQSCGELYGTDHMEIPVAIPAGDIRWLDPAALKACIEQNPEHREGNTIDATVAWSIPGGRTLEWTGTVGRIEAGVQAQTRTASLIIYVDNSIQASRERDDFFGLDINMYCRVSILGRVIPESYLLPRAAVQPDGTVFIAQPDEKSHTGYRLAQRKIEVVRFTDNQAMILPDGGLAAGEHVLLQAPTKAVIGMALELIEPVDTPATAPTTAPTTQK